MRLTLSFFFSLVLYGRLDSANERSADVKELTLAIGNGPLDLWRIFGGDKHGNDRQTIPKPNMNTQTTNDVNYWGYIDWVLCKTSVWRDTCTSRVKKITTMVQLYK